MRGRDHERLSARARRRLLKLQNERQRAGCFIDLQVEDHCSSLSCSLMFLPLRVSMFRTADVRVNGGIQHPLVLVPRRPKGYPPPRRIGKGPPLSKARYRIHSDHVNPLGLAPSAGTVVRSHENTDVELGGSCPR